MGSNHPTIYELYLTVPGNHANEKLEVELENHSGTKSATLTATHEYFPA